MTDGTHHRGRYDIAIIGGGINGCGIARDAAGRSLKVFLCEQADLGSGASSASSKLIHGGLRYLDQYQFKLVRESLREREILLKSAPHLIRPMRFVLPHHPRLRPAWMIRCGLLIYDLLAGWRSSLPRSKWLKLDRHHRNAALKPEFVAGFEYTDCHTDDSRLVIAVAKDARRLGADIAPHTRCDSVTRGDDFWELAVCHNNGTRTSIQAKAVVNAAGPWVAEAFTSATGGRVKLVQGSHIAVRKWYEGEHAYLLQNDDRRVIFVIPFQYDLAIIGTTEIEYRDGPDKVSNAAITDGEIQYLCAAVNRYFTIALTPADVVWSYSGVRPLYDDGADALREITRDYVIELEVNKRETAASLPMLTIYGGKLTTFRRLAEAAMAKLTPHFPALAPPWSADASLPGGSISGLDSNLGCGLDAAVNALADACPFLPRDLLERYLHAYGDDAFVLLGKVNSIADLGRHFGHGLYEIEAAYLLATEWATCAEDILWRRSKLGLRFAPDETAALEQWLASKSAGMISNSSTSNHAEKKQKWTLN